MEAHSQTSINSSSSHSTSTPPPPVPSYRPQAKDDDDIALSHIYESTDWRGPPTSVTPAIEITTAAEEDKEEGERNEEEGERNEEEEVDQNEEATPNDSPSKEGEMMRALYSYQAGDDDDLTFAEGDVVKVVEHCDGGWAKAFLGKQFGYIPESYFEPVKKEP